MERTSGSQCIVVMKGRLIIAVLIMLGINASAQVNFEFNEVLTNSFVKPTEKSKSGKYKAQKIKGKISGMGVFLYNDGSLYYGDLYDKEFQGKGTLISKDGISNCPGSSVYVGRFKEGQKSGKGRCYSASGELIYEGKFKDDRPIETYPGGDTQREDLPYFTAIKNSDYTFLGEFEGDNPNGIGMFVFSTGDLYLTQLKEGSVSGISVLIKPDDSWMSEKIEDGISTPISSSSHYAEIKKQASENFRSGLSVAMGYFSEAAQSGAQLAGQIKSGSAGNSIQSVTADMDSYSGESASSSGGSGDKTQNKYNLSEQQNYNRDKSIYHKYDGMLSKAFSGNNYATVSEIKEWQGKMRQLREKWESKGRSFPHFPNEDR